MLKAIVCFFKGHDLEKESIIPFMNRKNALRKCNRCGLYFAESEAGLNAVVTERTAMKWKQEFLEKFPCNENAWNAPICCTCKEARNGCPYEDDERLLCSAYDPIDVHEEHEAVWREEQALLCGVPVQVYTCSCCGERTLLRMTRYCGECGKRMRTYTLGPDD